MPKVFAALNCSTGYLRDAKDDRILLHKFPFNNSLLLNQWLRQISRGGFVPNANHRFVCAQNIFKKMIFCTKVKTQIQFLKCMFLKEGRYLQYLLRLSH